MKLSSRFRTSAVAACVFPMFAGTLCAGLVPAGLRVIWEADVEQAVGAKKACHLEFVLRNSGSEPVSIEDIAVNGTPAADLPTEKQVTIEDTRWWRAWPNPVPAGGMASLKLRLVDGAATLGDRSKTQELLVKTSGGDVKVPFKAEPSALWIPFVHFAPGLGELTVFVGNRGKAPVPVAPANFLLIDDKPAKVEAPGTSIPPGEVMPVRAILAAPLQEGALVAVQVQGGGQQVAATLRALPSTFGATYWFQVKDFDPEDLAAHNIRTDIPGSVCFLDEPFAARVSPMGVREKLEKSWDSDPARPVMMQETACQEVQVYAGLPDIVMTHHQWDNRDLELALALNWPRPAWYLPQNAWGRTENQTRHYRENFYPLADLDREAYDGLANGAKNIQWFSMQTLWWQNKQMAGGTDLARTEASVYFPGALANPAVWDRSGRMSALVSVLEPYLANSAPAFKEKLASGVEVSTLASGNPANAVVIAVDSATDLRAFYKAAGGTDEKLQTFDNFNLEAKIPSYLKADSAFLVDPYAGVSRLAFKREGNKFRTVIPKLQVGAAIVLGTAADGKSLEEAWKKASAGFGKFADAPGLGAVVPADVIHPAWQHPWPGDERCRDLDMAADGSKTLVARGPEILCFDAQGSIVWKKRFPGEVLAARFGKDGRVYSAANLNPDEGWNWTNTHILALDAQGNEVWKYPVGGTVFDIEASYPDGGVSYGTWGKIEKLDAGGNMAWSAGAAFRACDLSSDGQGNTYFSDNNSHNILDPAGQVVRKWREPAAAPFEPNLALAAAPDGSRVARGGYKFFLYDGGGAPLVQERIGRTVRVVAFSSDGSAVAAGTADGALRIYDRDGKRLADEHVPGTMVADIRPVGGDRFAVCRELFSYETDRGWRYRDTTEILDKTGKRLALVEGPWRTSPWMARVAASADGAPFAVAENEGVRFYSSADKPKPKDAPLPEGWSAQDFGAPRIHGSARYFPFDQSLLIVAAGRQWDKVPSSGFFAGTQVGDKSFTFTVRVRSIAGGAAYRGAGILVASSLEPSDTLAAFFYQPTQKTNRIYYRASSEGNYQSIFGKPGTPYEWLRVQRTGDTLNFSVSKDGEAWEPFGEEIQVPLGSDTRVGLVATSDAEVATAEAVFDHISLQKQ